MKRKLEYEVIKIQENYILVRITKQTHRCEELTKTGNVFRASNKHRLTSASSPQGDSANNTFIRGDASQYDNDIIWIYNKYYPKFKQAVEEYNKENQPCKKTSNTKPLTSKKTKS